MRTMSKRRGIAALLSTAVVAAVFGIAPTPASAAPTPALCLGRTLATQNLINTLADLFPTPGAPPRVGDATLEVNVDVDANVPQSVDVGATAIPVDFDVSVTLPDSLLSTVAGLGITSVDVQNQVATIAMTNSSPSSISSPSQSQTLLLANGGTVTVPNFGGAIDATGPDQSKIDYSLDSMVFDVQTPPISGLFPAGLFLELVCNSTSTDPVASTDILQPGPPIAPDVNTQVALGGTRTVTLPVSGNPAVDDVSIGVNGTLGTASIAQVGNQWRLTYVHDQANGDGTDTVTYVAHNAFGGGAGSTTTGTVSVEVLGNQCEANPSCSLDQIIEFDVEGTTLSMEQTGADVTLDTVTLDGTPQSTTGEINNVTVIDARGDGSGWDLVGSVTDFKTDPVVGNCPRGDSSTWDYRCIPANNLGWSPAAEVAHEVIPGDVAAVDAGATSDADDIAAGVAGSGLETDQALCTTEPTTNGGTFVCGAGLALLVPASASAGTYSATLTLTLS